LGLEGMLRRQGGFLGNVRQAVVDEFGNWGPLVGADRLGVAFGRGDSGYRRLPTVLCSKLWVKMEAKMTRCHYITGPRGPTKPPSGRGHGYWEHCPVPSGTASSRRSNESATAET